MIFASCLGTIIASMIAFFLFFSMMGAFITSITNSFKSEKTQKTAKLAQGSVLMLDLSGGINDKASNNPFETFPFNKETEKKKYTLSEINDAINIAAENANVEAIVLKLEKAWMGFAGAHELRDALQRFKDSGKKVYAYAERYGLGSYLVSSVADEVYMNPQGSVDISGLSSTTLFYTGVMKKFGVEMQVFKVGTFKGAVEPFTESKLSEANRLQIQTVLDGLWNGTKDEIASSRVISADSLQVFANGIGAFSPAEVVTRMNLVDSLFFGTELDDVIALKVTGDKEAEIKYLTVSDVLASYKSRSSGGEVAVLFAEGAISDVSPGNNPFGIMNQESVINRDLIDQLRKVADDDQVKAVVLRVNSPGGDAFLSELIHHEVTRIKEKKPIVVSMGNSAASGGYYISCGASKIIASPFTLTGSIGIFGMFPNYAGLANKLDLTYETVKTAELADIGNQYRPMSEKEKTALQGHIERGYDLFLSRVAEGRGMTKAQADSVGQGRVWLGSAALELGLVDGLGGLYDAIDEAARLADLDDYKVRYDIEDLSWFDKLLKMSSSEIGAMINTKFFMSPEEQMLRKHLVEIHRRSGIVALPPYNIEAVTPDMVRAQH